MNSLLNRLLMVLGVLLALVFCEGEAMISIMLTIDHPGLGPNVTYTAEPAAFGPSLTTSITGKLFAADPLTGCSSLINSPPSNDTYAWIALIQRGDCNFENKVLNAQNAGASFVIVFNNVTSIGNSLVTMSPGSDGGNQVTVPSAFITKENGYDLLGLFNQYNQSGLPIVIYQSGSGVFPSLDSQWAVIVFIGILAILISSFFIMIFLIVEIYRQRRRRRHHRRRPKPVPMEVIITLPIKEMTEEDLIEDKNLTCAICLDDFEIGSKVRRLPCGHLFHTTCVDPWLLKHNRVCPVCKQDILEGVEIKRSAEGGESIELSDLSRMSSSSQRDSNLETVISRDAEPRLPPCPEETDENSNQNNQNIQLTPPPEVSNENGDTVIEIGTEENSTTEKEKNTNEQQPETENSSAKKGKAKVSTGYGDLEAGIADDLEAQMHEERIIEDDTKLVGGAGKEDRGEEGNELDESERQKKRKLKGKAKLISFFTSSKN